jgi:putative membrane protein
VSDVPGDVRPPTQQGGHAEAGIGSAMAQAEGELRRLHPLTPFVRGWKVIAVAIAAIGQDAVRSLDFTQLLWTAAAVLPVAVGYGLISWWFTRFRIEGADLRLETGLVFRRTRHVKLDRLQAVDLVRPLLARFAGLAELRLEVAGGSSAEAPLAYLSEPDAQRLRAELLARAAGVSPESQEAPEQVLVQVPTGALLTSIALSIPTAVAFVVGIGVIVGAIVSRQLGVVFVMVPVGIGLASTGFNRFTVNFDFTVAESPDGLRLRHGLLEHRSQTVPPGRVQSIRIVQPLLWRRKGWVKVQVNVAGYAGQTGGDEKNSGDLLPVAPRATALGVIARVLPGVDVDAVELVPAPRAARWLRPVTWRRLAAGADDKVFVAQRGRFRRELDLIPHEKIQSVRLDQGPLQRRLGLATVHLDTTPGPVHVEAAHRDAGEGRAIVESEAELSRTARRVARPERWMTGT